VETGWVTETSSADSIVQVSIKIGHQTIYSLLRSYSDMKNRYLLVKFGHGFKGSVTIIRMEKNKDGKS